MYNNVQNVHRRELHTAAQRARNEHVHVLMYFTAEYTT